jgi:hypothetical protein
MLSLDASGYGRIVDTLGPIPQITRTTADCIHTIVFQYRQDNGRKGNNRIGLKAYLFYRTFV